MLYSIIERGYEVYMKYLKISFAILLIAIITNMIIAKAGVIYRRIGVIEVLTKQESNYTSYYEKNDFSNPTYENIESITTLSNPCADCKILVKMRTKDDKDASNGLITKMGTTHIFQGTAPKPDNWRLSVQRYDFTLLETTTKGYWFLNDQGIDSVG